MLNKKWTLVLLIFLSVDVLYSQNSSIGIIGNTTGKVIFPTVYVKDSLTEDFAKEFLTVNGKFFGMGYIREYSLKGNYSLEQIYSFLESSYSLVGDSDGDEQNNEFGGFKFFLTKDSAIVDFFETKNLKQTMLLFELFLDSCYKFLDRTDYDQILLSLEGIKDRLGPRYYEVAE